MGDSNRRSFVESVCPVLRQVRLFGPDPNEAIVARARLDPDAQAERDRHHEPVVVIGVLTYEIDPARRLPGRSTRHSPADDTRPSTRAAASSISRLRVAAAAARSASRSGPD